MSLWKSFLQLMGITQSPPHQSTPVTVKLPDPPPPSKEERIIAEMEAIVVWLRAFINKTLAETNETISTSWYERPADCFIGGVQVRMYRQVEGYYAVSMSWLVDYNRRLNKYSLRYQPLEEVWTQPDYCLAKKYLFDHLGVPLTWHRTVDTPLFGTFSPHCDDCDTPNFVFYVGELPTLETIDGQYTPENHGQLVEKQRTQRDVYRDFANRYLEKQAMWDARAFVSSLQERLTSSNATHLKPTDCFSGNFEDSAGLDNFQGYRFKTNGELTFWFYNRYGGDEDLREILAWCWTLQDYQRHYQDLFLKALSDVLAEHTSSEQRWEVKRKDLLWGKHPDTRCVEMRFVMTEVYSLVKR